MAHPWPCSLIGAPTPHRAPVPCPPTASPMPCRIDGHCKRPEFLPEFLECLRPQVLQEPGRRFAASVEEVEEEPPPSFAASVEEGEEEAVLGVRIEERREHKALHSHELDEDWGRGNRNYRRKRPKK